MSDVPRGWVETTFSEIFDYFQYGLTAKANSNVPGTRFLRITDIHSGTVSWDFVPGLVGKHDLERYLLADGDFVFARSGSIEKAARLVNPPNAVFASYLIRARPLVPQTADYLAHFVRSDGYLAQIADRAAGIGMLNVNAAKLGTIVVSIPPLPEQRRIVAKIDSLTGKSRRARDHLDHVPRLVEKYKQAILAAAFRGDLTNHDRVENGWQAWTFQRAVDVCCKVQSGGTPKSGFINEGVPFLKVYNLVDQSVSFHYKPQFIDELVHKSDQRKSITYPGDVLMNIVGPPLGKVAIVPNCFEEWAINQALVLFRPSEKVSSEWIYYFLCSGLSVESVLDETKGSAGQVNISLSQCRNFIFPVPSVIEQEEIVRRIKSAFIWVDRLAADATSARKLINHLDQAVLAKAFKGELVPQDPADEPASTLLERMKAERAVAPKVKRGRKKVTSTMLTKDLYGLPEI